MTTDPTNNTWVLQNGGMRVTLHTTPQKAQEAGEQLIDRRKTRRWAPTDFGKSWDGTWKLQIKTGPAWIDAGPKCYPVVIR